VVGLSSVPTVAVDRSVASVTRSLAITEGPRDALSQSKFCQTLHSCTTNYPHHLYLAPLYGVTPLEFRRNFRPQKTKVSGLSHDVVCVILCLAALVQCRLMSDGRTDGRHTTTAYTALA